MKPLVLFATLLTFSCGDLKEESNTVGPKLVPSRVQTIFTNSCSCHTSSSPSADMHLVADQAYSQVVDHVSTEVPSLKRIQPGNAGNSYLVKKIEGTQSVGNRMPADGPPYLTQANIDTIKSWINAGALPE